MAEAGKVREAAPWRTQLERAWRENPEESARFVQLATVNSRGGPAVRSMICRGLLRDSDTLLFVTDARSHKVKQTADNHWGEACWYFPETREQFRFAGHIRLTGETTKRKDLAAARARLWREVSSATRASFYWPQPGRPRDDETDAVTSVEATQKPPANFFLLSMRPVRVDHLFLRPLPHTRLVHYFDDQQTWHTASIYP